MKIEFHPEAKKNFDDKACALAPAIETRKYKTETSTSSIPDPRYSTQINGEDIVFGIGGYTNGFGQRTAIFKFEDAGEFGFFDGNYQKLKEFAGLIKLKCKGKVSQKFIEERYLEWVIETQKKVNGETQNFVDYLSAKAEEVIKPFKIGVPVENLYLQSPLQFGQITFEYIEERSFIALQELFLKSETSEEHKKKVEEKVIEYRKDYQGKIIATMALESEYEAALETFSIESNKAVTILKFFSPPAYVSQLTSYIGLRGSVHLSKQNVIRFEHGTIIPHERLLVEESLDWHISNSEYQEMETTGLRLVREMALKEKKNDLELSSMESINLFVKGITSSNFHDRLVLILVSVESLLLKDSEPVSSFKSRLAILCHEAPQERSVAIGILSKAYALRSGYLHHGNSSSKDVELLGAVQILCHTVILRVIQLAQKFSNRDQLIQAIEDLSLRVPSSTVLLQPQKTA